MCKLQCQYTHLTTKLIPEQPVYTPFTSAKNDLYIMKETALHSETSHVKIFAYNCSVSSVVQALEKTEFVSKFFAEVFVHMICSCRIVSQHNLYLFGGFKQATPVWP